MVIKVNYILYIIVLNYIIVCELEYSPILARTSVANAQDGVTRGRWGTRSSIRGSGYSCTGTPDSPKELKQL